MELAAAFGDATSGSLILAAIASVFTIRYVANLLGEDEDWLHQLSIDMFPEDGWPLGLRFRGGWRGRLYRGRH